MADGRRSSAGRTQTATKTQGGVGESARRLTWSASGWLLARGSTDGEEFADGVRRPELGDDPDSRSPMAFGDDALHRVRKGTEVGRLDTAAGSGTADGRVSAAARPRRVLGLLCVDDGEARRG